jgi:hypothetical protein
MEIIFMGNKNFYYLIQEVMGNEIKYTQTPDLLYKVNREFILVTEGEKTENFEIKNIKYLKKIIIFTNKLDVEFLNYLIDNNIAFNAYKKEKYVFIGDYIKKKTAEREKTEPKRIKISDLTREAYLNLDSILYFSYDRHIKKSFAKTEKDIFYSRMGLGEIEEELKESRKFQRAERSFIVNTEKILYINFKDEYIKFENGEIIYMGRKKLKEISEQMEEEIKKL